MNNGLSRCYCHGWRERFGELGLDPEGISVFYDDKGYLRVFGTSDIEQQTVVEECEVDIYRRREAEFRSKYAEPVEGWWNSLEKYSEVAGGILTISYGNQRFRIKRYLFDSMLPDLRVYRLFDEFYVENGMPGLDEIISSVLEEELLTADPEERNVYGYGETECEAYF